MKYRKSSSSASSSQSSQNASKKGRRQPSPVEEEAAEENEISPIEAEQITWIERAMPNYLDTLSLVAENLSFKRYPAILKETIECMLPVMSFNRDRVCTETLRIVQEFCNPLHGEATQTVLYVFSYVLPYLTLDPTNEKDLNNKDLVALKDISYDLVRNFMDNFGEAILPLLKRLIQHLCTEVVDRAEFRQRTAQTALDLLQLVPEQHQQGITKKHIPKKMIIFL